MWKAILTCIGIFLSLAKCDELYMTSVPTSIKIVQEEVSHLQPNDVSFLVNFLLGFSSQKTDASYGVRSLDIFSRPKGNLFVNLILPQGVTYTPDKFDVEYTLDNSDGQHLSFLPTASALKRAFGDDALLIDFEATNEGFALQSTHADISWSADGLPMSATAMQLRLLQSDSVVHDQQLKCLSPDQDITFFGELQMLADIAAKLSGSGLPTDVATDFIYISITSINGLASTYGADSCQVEEAMTILQRYLPLFMDSMKEYYNQELLSEVRVAHFNEERVFSRQRRAVTDAETPANGTMMEGYKPNTFHTEDFATVINMSVWVVVVFALAVLAASYALWFLDPGRDNIVYRMTMQRSKTD